MDAGAFDTQQDAQVDGGPAGVGLTTVAALLVPRQTLDALQDGLPAHAALPGLTGRVDAAGGWRRCSVQMLKKQQRNTQQDGHLQNVPEGFPVQDIYPDKSKTHIKTQANTPQ